LKLSSNQRPSLLRAKSPEREKKGRRENKDYWPLRSAGHTLCSGQIWSESVAFLYGVAGRTKWPLFMVFFLSKHMKAEQTEVATIFVSFFGR
jgi:hypothetical protein